MSTEISVEEYVINYNLLRETDKKIFSKVCNRLLNETFLIKSIMKDRNDFYFIQSNFSLVKCYLSIIDYELIFDESKGIIYIKTTEDRNRTRLNKFETVIILILRLTYYKKCKEISSFDKVIISVEELNEEIRKTQIYNTSKKITDFEIALKKLKRSKIIDFNITLMTNDSNIEILPTILVVVGSNLDALKKKLESFKPDGGEDSDEEIDED